MCNCANILMLRTYCVHLCNSLSLLGTHVYGKCEKSMQLYIENNLRENKTKLLDYIKCFVGI